MINPTLLQELTTADDTRVTAITTADKALLESIIADDLQYAHSSGARDTKDSLIDLITSGRTRYLDIAYVERNFIPSTEDIALMTGKVRITSQTAPNDPGSAVFSILVVWKKVGDAWKFHAWQSAFLAAESANQ